MIGVTIPPPTPTPTPTAPLSELLRVRPGRADPGWADLTAVDPRATPGLPDGDAVREDPKAWAQAGMADLGERLADLQQRLYASARGAATGSPPTRHRVLLVLQAMDCGGKDGALKRVARAMNPLGMRIVAFGPPTAEELSHHFLWRIGRALPEVGEVGVFNRSHYEDVLIARVEGLVPPRTWRTRYEQINRFERDLAGDGLTWVKVMLHISYKEQGKRLLRRLDDPTKHWKYNPSDVEARWRWADYQEAYAEALTRCSPDHAPWYVVPADRKWYRDWAVMHLLIEAMSRLDLEYPRATVDVDAERQRVRATLAPGEQQVNGA
jgi:PPK2 family polyphosphate:nucleotide phosphotransferase